MPKRRRTLVAVVISGGRAGRSGPIARGWGRLRLGASVRRATRSLLEVVRFRPGRPGPIPAPIAAGPDPIAWDRVGSGVARPSGSTAVRLRSHVGLYSALARSTPHGVAVSVTPAVGPDGTRHARRAPGWIARKTPDPGWDGCKCRLPWACHPSGIPDLSSWIDPSGGPGTRRIGLKIPDSSFKKSRPLIHRLDFRLES